MSTSGSFDPPQEPACAYEPRMTRAAALALRAAGGLDPNCVIVVTDGPVIGTAGNTSPTEIELQPVTATDLGSAALVHTTFDNVAFTGMYDIDSGPSGSINRLTDNWGNVILDEDTNAPTVHTQFPYHKAGPELRGNKIDDCVLSGWAAATGEINDNDIRESTVNLTGMTFPTAGPLHNTFSNNIIRTSDVAVSTPDFVLFTTNEITDAQLNFLGTGRLGFFSNNVLTGRINIDTASDAFIIIARCVIVNTFRFDAVASTLGDVNLAGCRLSGTDASAPDLTSAGPADHTLINCDIRSSSILMNGPGVTRMEDTTIGGSTVTKASGSVGPLNLIGCQLTNTTIVVDTANMADNNLVLRGVIRGGNIQFTGPGTGGTSNIITIAMLLGLSVTVNATATAGVFISGGVYSGGQVTQSRTAGTAPLEITNCTTLGTGCTITDSGAVAPPGTVALRRVTLTESQVSMAGVTTGSIQETDMVGSSITVSGAASVIGGRLTRTAVTTGGFNLDAFDILGQSHVLTANNVNVVSNPGFSNIV